LILAERIHKTLLWVLTLIFGKGFKFDTAIPGAAERNKQLELDPMAKKRGFIS
jgi:hypothetical protein